MHGTWTELYTNCFPQKEFHRSEILKKDRIVDNKREESRRAKCCAELVATDFLLELQEGARCAWCIWEVVVWTAPSFTQESKRRGFDLWRAWLQNMLKSNTILKATKPLPLKTQANLKANQSAQEIEQLVKVSYHIGRVWFTIVRKRGLT